MPFRTELERIASWVAGLLNEIDRLNPSLDIIAWAHALLPALKNMCVRALMESVLGIDVVNKKAKEVAGEPSRLRESVQELIKLIRGEDFMGLILKKISNLVFEWALYKLNNDELREAEELFNEAARERREIGDYENYPVARGWALRAKTIRDRLAGEDLLKLIGMFIDELRQLYEETSNKKPFELTAGNLSIASHILSNSLVSLALMGNHETINKWLEEHRRLLNADKQVSVLTRLMLNALLGPRGGLSGELEGKLGVNPEELIDAFESHMLREFLPALRVALNIAKPEVGIKLCEEFNDEVCIYLVLAVKGNSVAVKQLREWVINAFNNSLKGFGFDVESLINEFRGLVSGLDGRSLVQLIAPSNSMAQLALMLHALINGNKELAKALALYGAIYYSSKLLRRLFLEVYKECCDLESESFRLALARLFFLHV
jgi:hypothetical protein